MTKSRKEGMLAESREYNHIGYPSKVYAKILHQRRYGVEVGARRSPFIKI